jgi:hypothetical protein
MGGSRSCVSTVSSVENEPILAVFTNSPTCVSIVQQSLEVLILRRESTPQELFRKPMDTEELDLLTLPFPGDNDVGGDRTGLGWRRLK